MKLLIASPTFAKVTHGPAKFARLLFSHFPATREGYDLRVLTESAEVDARIYPIKISLPRPLHAFVKVARGFKYHRRAMEIKNDFDFEYLLFNDGVTGFWSAYRLRNTTIKVIVMVNDDKYLTIGGNQQLPLRKRLIFLFYRQLEQLAVRYATLTFACSEYLQQQIFRQYQTTASVKLLYQAIQIPAPVKRSYDITAPVKILFVKSDPLIGGLTNLLEALVIIKEYEFAVSVVGPATEMRSKYEKIIQKIRGGVTFLGARPQEDVFDLMLSHDILCTPSLTEGLGVANIEGLAHEIAVVATNVGGIPEVLGNGQFGWLAKPNDPISLARSLEECIQTDQSERARRAKAGREYVEKKFGVNTMIKAFTQYLSDAKG